MGPKREGHRIHAEMGQNLEGEPVSFIKDRKIKELAASLWVWTQEVGSCPVLCLRFHCKRGVKVFVQQSEVTVENSCGTA